MGVVEQYLLQLNTEKRRWRRAVAILTALSLIVALATVWNLRMTGVTIANDASCGYKEHQHTDECMMDAALNCGKEEHIHNAGCYSNPKADTESMLEWQRMFADYPYTGELRSDLVGIAKTQVGYCESLLNYEADEAGVRRGYTRYGDWYGAPYNDWSAIFVSFCLNYAGADENEFPESSGASLMSELWKEQDRFVVVGQYIPQSGDIVFFDNNTAGIVSEVYNATFNVIRGDVDDMVTADVIALDDQSIVGWGITDEKIYIPNIPNEDTFEEESTAVETTEEEETTAEPLPEDFLFWPFPCC